MFMSKNVKELELNLSKMHQFPTFRRLCKQHLLEEQPHSTRMRLGDVERE